MNRKKQFLILLFVLSLVLTVTAQTEDETSGWDNQLYIGNKVAIGKNDWRYSGELQVRLKNNMQNLDYWFLEGMAAYMISEKWELTPDLRFSIEPEEIEIRPGFGVVNKLLSNKIQFVNQVKWQIDIDNKGNSENGLRYVAFLNYKLSDHLIPNFVAGGFYRWKDNFNGIQFFRFGPGFAYVIDVKHVINFNYMVSTKNDGESWHWAGISLVQFVVNINKEYKYLPAKYFNF